MFQNLTPVVARTTRPDRGPAPTVCGPHHASLAHSDHSSRHPRALARPSHRLPAPAITRDPSWPLALASPPHRGPHEREEEQGLAGGDDLANPFPQNRRRPSHLRSSKPPQPHLGGKDNRHGIRLVVRKPEHTMGLPHEPRQLTALPRGMPTTVGNRRQNRITGCLPRIHGCRAASGTIGHDRELDPLPKKGESGSLHGQSHL